MRKNGSSAVLTDEALPTVAKGGKPPARTIFRGLEKPKTAAPAATECGAPAAFTPGPAYQAGPTPTLDGALYLAAEILWPEIWPAALNSELWGAGPEDMCRERWKNDASGYSFDH